MGVLCADALLIVLYWWHLEAQSLHIAHLRFRDYLLAASHIVSILYVCRGDHQRVIWARVPTHEVYVWVLLVRKKIPCQYDA